MKAMSPMPSRYRIRADDPAYPAFLQAVAETFAFHASAEARLFTVDTAGLYDLYLASFPAAVRQHYTCHACRRFIEQFGGIVTIQADGTVLSAVWDGMPVPEAFCDVATALAVEVARRPITGLFRHEATALGTPATGPWLHLSATLPSAHRHTDRLRTPEQVSAALRENVELVRRTLATYPANVVLRALALFTSEAVVRSEKFIGPMQWLLGLHTARAVRRPALLWRAVALAPEGYAHIRTSVLGPLLDAVAAGHSVASIQRQFAHMLHPLRYQRPQVAPTVGNIAAAERTVEKLGIAPALARRFARLDECVTLWQPMAEAAPGASGVFGHLAPKAAPAPRLTLPATKMTWAKFQRDVLPVARRIEVDPPLHGHYMGLVTAVDATAPVLHKWGHPVSGYVYSKGSHASIWRVSASVWTPVTGIVPFPHLWGASPMPQFGEGVLFVLAGAVDTRTDSGNALFPETLRGDLHGVRATIEAYSQQATLGGREQASACGLGFGQGRTIRLRVRTADTVQEITLDRWE